MLIISISSAVLVGAYFDNRVKPDASINRPVRPPWPELLCSRPPPAAAAGAHGLEGHAHATGRLPGPLRQPAVTILRFESLGAARHSPALDLHAPAPFASSARLLRRVWAISNCADAGPARVQGVSHQINPLLFALCIPGTREARDLGGCIFHCPARTRIFSLLFPSWHLPHPVLFLLV